MARRVIKRAICDDIKLLLAYNHECAEYQVRYHNINGFNEAKTYYTDNKQDAIETMKAIMVENNKDGIWLIK